MIDVVGRGWDVGRVQELRGSCRRRVLGGHAAMDRREREGSRGCGILGGLVGNSDGGSSGLSRGKGTGAENRQPPVCVWLDKQNKHLT